MEIHSDDDCERFWRDRISDQLEQETARSFPSDSDAEKWFKEGIRYAIMMIRWDIFDL